MDDAFEEKWLGKKVLYDGTYWQIPKTQYTVTAALYKHEDDDISIFAIMGEGYKIGINPCWYTFKLALSELELLDKHFTIIGE